MRPKKKIISLDPESALALMQEIYNDILEQKSIASLILKKMNKFLKDAEDMTTIGPVIKEQQKILNDCTEKKLSLVKIQHSLIKQLGSSGIPNQMGAGILTEEDKRILETLLNDSDKNKPNDKKTGTYRLS